MTYIAKDVLVFVVMFIDLMEDILGDNTVGGLAVRPNLRGPSDVICI